MVRYDAIGNNGIDIKYDSIDERKTNILILGPGKKYDYNLFLERKIIAREIVNYNLGYNPVIYDDMPIPNGMINGFEDIVKRVDYIIPIFFKNIDNVSVNFEMGLMSCCKNDELEKVLILRQEDAKFERNPYVDTLNVNVPVSVFNFEQSHRKPSHLIHVHIVTNEKRKKHNM